MTDQIPGPIEAAVLTEFTDAPASLLQLALSLARSQDEQPQAATAKQLHDVLRTLSEHSGRNDIDDLVRALSAPIDGPVS